MSSPRGWGSPVRGSRKQLHHITQQHTRRKRLTIDFEIRQPKMQDKNKTFFGIQPARLCPNSCAMDDGRQMGMTNRDTPHALKINAEEHRPSKVELKGVKSRIATVDLTGLDCVREPTAFRRSYSPACDCSTCRCGRRLRLCVSRYTFLVASTWSSSTIDRTPSRNSRTIAITVPVSLRQRVDNHPLVWYSSAPRSQCLHASPDHPQRCTT